MELLYKYIYPATPHTEYLIYGNGKRYRYTKSVSRGTQEHIIASNRLIKMDEFFKRFVK